MNTIPRLTHRTVPRMTNMHQLSRRTYFESYAKSPNYQQYETINEPECE